MDCSKNKTPILFIVEGLKNILQYLIGAGIFYIITLEIAMALFPSMELPYPFIQKYIDMPVLQMVSYGLGAATALELAYMLFTPGPDEAVQPVMMGVASAVLYILSDSNKLDGVMLIGIALLICTIPLLVWLNHKMKDWQE